MKNINFFFFVYIISSYSFAGVIGFGYFWHISDTHVDQNYSRNGNVDHMCHQDQNSSDTGLFGNFLCDSPEYLVNYTIQAMCILHPKPDFIVWTGDTLPHTRPDPTWEVTYEGIRNTTQTLVRSFPGVPIVPSIGNHDTFPANQLSPSALSVYRGYLQEGTWNTILPTQAQDTFSKGGYFSYVLKPGLRIISLNTILWYRPNTDTASIADPADQFAWLEQVLSNSSQASEKVYIIGHVPPGFYNRAEQGKKSDPTYHDQHLTRYVGILNDHVETVIGQFYGHLHMDLFQIFKYGKDDGYRGSSLLASSVSPWHTVDKDNVSLPVNPSVRLVKFSNSTHGLLDLEQYYLNLTEANSSPSQENETLYKLLYRFTDAYSVPDLSTESLVKVYENLFGNTNGTFSAFFKYLTAGKESVTCDRSCQQKQLCAMTSSTKEEYEYCFHVKGEPSIFFWCVFYLMLFISIAILIYYHFFWSGRNIVNGGPCITKPFLFCYGITQGYGVTQDNSYQYIQISSA